LKGGRYENIEIGNGNTALLHLTGGVSYSVNPRRLLPSAIFIKVHYCLDKDKALVTGITTVGPQVQYWAGRTFHPNNPPAQYGRR